MSKPHVPLDHMQRCGANAKRTQQPCRAPAMANGRCKYHGGKSNGRPVTTGQWTKKGIQQRKAVSQLINQSNLIMQGMAEE